MYNQYKGQVNKIYITEVISDKIVGDAKFDMDLDMRKWRAISEEDFPESDSDQYPTRFSIFERKTKIVRQRQLHDFYTLTSEDIINASKFRKGEKITNGIFFKNNNIQKSIKSSYKTLSEIEKILKK